MEALVPFEPGADLGVLVRRIVVDDQVQLRSGRGLAVDLIEEADEFLMPMARHARAGCGRAPGSATSRRPTAPAHARAGRYRARRHPAPWRQTSHRSTA